MTAGPAKPQARPRAGGLALALGCVLLTACGSPGRTMTGLAVAPDFALEFHVQGVPGWAAATAPATAQATAPGNADPFTQTSQYVLEPNGNLRVGVGEGASDTYFPHVTRMLEPAQVEALFALVRDRHLMAEPTSPAAEQAARSGRAGAALYTVTIRAFAETHRYTTTAAESPPTVQLLSQLVALRSGHAGPPVPSEIKP